MVSRRHLLIGIVWPVSFALCQVNPNPQPPPGKFDDPAARKSPALQSVGVRGTIDSGGYGAPAVTRAQTQLAEGIIRLQLEILKSAYTSAAGLPCEQRHTLEQRVALNPSDVMTRRALASFYLGHSETALTIDLLKPVVETSDDPGLRNQLGLAYELQGELEAAEQQFHSVARKDKNDNNTFVWGVSLVLIGQSDRALAIFRDVAAPRSPFLAIGEAVALFNLGRGDQALSILLQCAETKPADSAPLELVTAILRTVSPSAATLALQRLRILAQRAPGNAWAQYAYASAILASCAGSPDSNQIAEIEKLLQSAVQLEPRLADAHFQLAALLAGQQNTAGAISEYQTAIEANPNFADAHYRLSQLFRRTGKTGLAQQELAAYQRLREEQERQSREQQIFEEAGFSDRDRCAAVGLRQKQNGPDN